MRRERRNNTTLVLVFIFALFSCRNNVHIIPLQSNSIDGFKSHNFYVLDSNQYTYNDFKPIQMIGGVKLKTEINSEEELLKFTRLYRKTIVALIKNNGDRSTTYNYRLNSSFIDTNLSSTYIENKIDSCFLKQVGISMIKLDSQNYYLYLYKE